MRFLLLDRITSLERDRATAVKCVSLADDVFVDHFPGHPVLPGTLIVEALAQLGGVLAEAAMRTEATRPEAVQTELHALLTMIHKAKFRRVVRPGDRMELEAKLVTVSEDGGQVRGTAMVDGQLAAEAELGFAFAKVTNERLIAHRRAILEVWLHGTIESP